MSGITLKIIEGTIVVLLDSFSSWSDHAAELEENASSNDSHKGNGNNKDKQEQKV
jgi:hypothetical protein